MNRQKKFLIRVIAVTACIGIVMITAALAMGASFAEVRSEVETSIRSGKENILWIQ